MENSTQETERILDKNTADVDARYRLLIEEGADPNEWAFAWRTEINRGGFKAYDFLMKEIVDLGLRFGVVILGLFHFAIPPIVDTITRNSWVKLPVMLILGFVAGVFMAWLHYVPYLILFFWLALNKYTLAVMPTQNLEGATAWPSRSLR